MIDRDASVLIAKFDPTDVHERIRRAGIVAVPLDDASPVCLAELRVATFDEDLAAAAGRVGLPVRRR